MLGTVDSSGVLGALQDPNRLDPEAMAVQRLELELKKVRQQFECECVALRIAKLEQ